MYLFPDDIMKLAQQVVERCRAQDIKIALAESCTGGLVAGALTEIPGSSAILDRGFVVYSNEAKMQLLGVGVDIIDTFGAVSEATAWAMAHGALHRSKASVAVGITGIAGPDGGTAQKPVGTVVFARAYLGEPPDHSNSDTSHFGDIGRTAIRLEAVRVALGLLLV